eukprot:TRINITY_DN34731_c0_g1_i1.p1 TRINITY_DN34731_c0_g1~~TRINITY_DN34731_c0_g1_i1.p1  ORF type:complete len:429 (+),score=80.86 TRINITY_DN34731_c0_g1_i1:81-1289(+)
MILWRLFSGTAPFADAVTVRDVRQRVKADERPLLTPATIPHERMRVMIARMWSADVAVRPTAAECLLRVLTLHAPPDVPYAIDGSAAAAALRTSAAVARSELGEVTAAAAAVTALPLAEVSCTVVDAVVDAASVAQSRDTAMAVLRAAVHCIVKGPAGREDAAVLRRQAAFQRAIRRQRSEDAPCALTTLAQHGVVSAETVMWWSQTVAVAGPVGASRGVVGALGRVWVHATSPEAVEAWACAISCLTGESPTDAVNAARLRQEVCSERVVEGLGRVWPYATTTEAAYWWLSAICNLTFEVAGDEAGAAERRRVVCTEQVAEGLVDMWRHLRSVEATRAWVSAIFFLTFVTPGDAADTRRRRLIVTAVPSFATTIRAAHHSPVCEGNTREWLECVAQLLPSG